MSNPYQSPDTITKRGDPSQWAVRREDPVLVSSRREALAVLLLWLVSFAWTIGYCWRHGYHPQPEPTLVLGIPSWVMWGVFFPWTCCTIASTLLAWRFIADDDLGRDTEEEALHLEEFPSERATSQESGGAGDR